MGETGGAKAASDVSKGSVTGPGFLLRLLEYVAVIAIGTTVAFRLIVSAEAVLDGGRPTSVYDSGVAADRERGEESAPYGFEPVDRIPHFVSAP
jgi:hypothetical protein